MSQTETAGDASKRLSTEARASKREARWTLQL